MIYITVALVLLAVLVGVACVLVFVLVGNWMLERAAMSADLKRWTDAHIAEVADVAEIEAEVDERVRQSRAVADALAVLAEIDALFADPDVALKLALIAERQAA